MKHPLFCAFSGLLMLTGLRPEAAYSQGARSANPVEAAPALPAGWPLLTQSGAADSVLRVRHEARVLLEQFHRLGQQRAQEARQAGQALVAPSPPVLPAGELGIQAAAAYATGYTALLNPPASPADLLAPPPPPNEFMTPVQNVIVAAGVVGLGVGGWFVFQYVTTLLFSPFVMRNP